MTYAAGQLLDEVAYVAFHYHWPLDSVLDLEHPDRRHFADQLPALLGSEES